MLLELLNEAFPEDETLPSNYYEAKKILRDLGLHYIKIDACPLDCMLYSKEHANVNECVFVVSLDGNQVMIILHMSSLIQQRKKKSC